MKNCGRRFHNEVGKFRFLNELIKVVSPKVSCTTIVSCEYSFLKQRLCFLICASFIFSILEIKCQRE